MARALGIRRRRRGIVAIEFALILPLLLLLVLGLMEVGWMILKSQQITNAARQGARVGIRLQAHSSEVLAAIDTMMADGGLGGSGYTRTIVPGEPRTVDSPYRRRPSTTGRTTTTETCSAPVSPSTSRRERARRRRRRGYGVAVE